MNDCDLPNKTKLLGLNWDKRKDTLTFTFNKEIKPVTKRDVLHTVNFIYDPLGLIEPLKIIGKHLYRDACDTERRCDKVLPPEFQNQWKKWIHGLDTVCIPRSITNVLQPIKYIDLHMFGDSSQIASAMTGIAVISQLSKETSGIVASRARIAKRGVTMPCLELIANHMNFNMGCNIYNALSKVVEVKQVYMWTDSQTALRRITNPQLPWKQFVGNRVRKINEKDQEMKVKWLYCPTEDNIADVPTRGCKASQVTDKWWKGSDWLLDKRKWPEQPVIELSKLSEEERKQIKEIHLFTAVKTKDNIGNLITRKSYWSSLRITSWIFRFCHNALKKVRQEKLITGPITTKELINAITFWILRAQKEVVPTADNV